MFYFKRLLVLIPAGIVGYILLWMLVGIGRRISYRRSEYFRAVRIPYRRMKADAGRSGEYQLYRKLCHAERNGAHFLFNAYIPEDGHTTEIDVMMIDSRGVYVFESKNYSGWIFGEERQINWCQTFPSGQQTKFLNPAMQNRGHVKALRKRIGRSIPIFPVVVFSDRCTLKSVNGGEVRVVRRGQLAGVIREIHWKHPAVLSPEEADALYADLLPCTHVRDCVKRKHEGWVRRQKRRSWWRNLFLW